MSLRDGTKKMSKSDSSDLSRINLTDNKDLIINKIKKAKTDPLPLPSKVEELKKDQKQKNLLGIFSSLTDQTLEESIDEFSGKNFSEFKEKLSQVLVEKLDPISKEIQKLLNDRTFLDKILLEGQKRQIILHQKRLKKCIK